MALGLAVEEAAGRGAASVHHRAIVGRSQALAPSAVGLCSKELDPQPKPKGVEGKAC